MNDQPRAVLSLDEQRPRSGGWVLREILLPLIPFAVSAFVRWLLADVFSLSIFDAKDFAFTMSFFCLLVVISAHRQTTSRAQSQSIATPFLFGMFLFSAMFVVAVVLETQSTTLASETLTAIAQNPTNAATFLSTMEKTTRRNEQIITTIRTVSWALGAITILFGVVCRVVYKLQD